MTLTLSLLPAVVAAQSLPILHPVNPVAEARSGLYFQPLVPVHSGWKVSTGLDYASMVEIGFRGSLADTSYLLDAEVLRVNLAATRNLGTNYFLAGEVWGGGSYNGFLDGFLDWYHGLFGIVYPERENRPHNDFRYFYEDAQGVKRIYGRRDFGLGALRLGLGRRWGYAGQSVLSFTLPTSTMGSGYARGVPSVSLLNTYRAELTSRLIYEGSFNAGYTPTHGPLKPYQKDLFFLLTSGARWRTVGGLWSFANLYLGSPYYKNTGAGQLDNWEFTIDFGWMIRGKRGREFRFGMTEDLAPSGPAVDANFRLGYSW